MKDLDPRFLVTASRRILANNNCESQVAGHVSMRASGEDAFWVTPFQYFDETMPSDVNKVDFDLQVLEGSMLASPAIQFHSAIYRARPDIGSVIHTHSHFVSVFVTTRRFIDMYNVESVLFANDQVLYEDDGTRPAVEGPRLADTLGEEKHIILIKNHGAVIAGETIAEATIKALTLERCARYHLEAEAIGGTVFPEAYVTRSNKKYHEYFLPQMWEANLRRLRKSDPEIFTRESLGTVDPAHLGGEHLAQSVGG